MLTRRRFLQTSMAGTALLSSFDRLSFANTGEEARFVLIILRGGMDGLAAVPAYADAAYEKLRGNLALGAPNRAKGVLDLDGFFGLHPTVHWVRRTAGLIGFWH